MDMDGIKPQKTAVLYARVSSEEQAKKGLSIDSQLEQGRKKAKALGATVVREFVDDGISGRTDNRPAFQEAIEYCEVFSPDYMIMWSTSRFFRNKLLAAMYKSRLEKAGVEWIYTSVDLGGKDDASWLAEGVFELFDEYTSRVNASATRAAMMKNARSGHWNGGATPFGFRAAPDPADPRRKKLVPDPGEALLVEKIFELKAREQMGARRIAHHLNTRGHTYRGRKWAKTTVHNILKSPAVIGQTVFNKKNRVTGQLRPREEWVVVDSHEPVVPIELWEKVQASLVDAPGGRPYDNKRSPLVLSRLLECAECGAPMTVDSANGRGKRYYYYVCNAARYEKAHKIERFPADELDRWLVDEICKRIFNQDTLQEIIGEIKLRASNWIKDARRERAEIEKELRDIDRRRRGLLSVLEELGRDAPNLKDMSERLHELREQKAKAESRLQEIDESRAPTITASAEDVMMMQGFLLEVVQAASPGKIKKFLQTFVESITLSRSDICITYDSGKLAQTSGVVRENRIWLPVRDTSRTIQVSVPAYLQPRGRINVPREVVKRWVAQ